MSKKLIKISILMLLTVSLLATNVLAATLTTGGATVDADALNLRSEANTTSEIKAVMSDGTFLLVTDTLDGWYKVIYNGVEGFVSADFVDYAYTLDGKYATKGVISGMSVRMRSQPNTSSAILGYYNTGAEFSILGVSGDWLKVSTAAGVVGYIRSDFVNCTGAKSAGDTWTSLGSQMVASAKNYLGVPYVWAGMSPSGFDCSGFVNYIYDLYGYDLDRVAQSIYSNNGVFVDKANLQIGDIVCFGYSGSSINHVGIYIGDGQFIHASSGRGKVVISSLSENYYTRMYVGAKRVIG